MRRQFTIPLSYNPIDADQLVKKLHEYSNAHHDDMIEDFEQKLGLAAGTKYAVALNSGTSAIHLGLKALGVGEKDLVLVSTFTYVATVNPILYLNAIPVFIDSERETWNMDPDVLESAIKSSISGGKKPKVILVVHTYGMPAQMDRILEVSHHYDIPILEDAAEAIGSSYNNKPLGSFGEIGILSFNNNKILTTYGGGALLTNNLSIAEKTLKWSTQSRENLPYNEHSETGFNYRLSPLNAAVGLAELESLESNVAKRRTIFDTYRNLLGDLPGVAWQPEPANSFSNRWFTCMVLRHDVDAVRQILDSQNIETRPLWKPMHLQPLMKTYPAFANGTSEELFNTGLCLPSGNNLREDDISKIVEQIKNGVRC